MTRDREVGLDEHATCLVEWRPERPGQGCGGHPGRPEHGAGWDLLAAEPHRVRRHPRDAGVGADLDADTPERVLGAPRQRLGEGGQDARPAFEQDDAGLGRIDETEVAGDRLARDLAESARQLDAGGTAADDHEREERPLLGAVVLALGRLVG